MLFSSLNPKHGLDVSIGILKRQVLNMLKEISRPILKLLHEEVKHYQEESITFDDFTLMLMETKGLKNETQISKYYKKQIQK